MTLSIVIAIAAFIIGGYIFFSSKTVEHRIGIAFLMIILITSSILYDNASYLFGYCLHSDCYIESSGSMTRRGHNRGFHRALLSYYEDGEVKWTNVPVAFYEEVPQKIPIMMRCGEGNYAMATRTQIIVTGRTLILIAIGIWILLACILKSSLKKEEST